MTCVIHRVSSIILNSNVRATNGRIDMADMSSANVIAGSQLTGHDQMSDHCSMQMPSLCAWRRYKTRQRGVPTNRSLSAKSDRPLQSRKDAKPHTDHMDTDE